MTPRVRPPEDGDRPEHDDRERLRELESRSDALLERRRKLLGELRRISGEQRSLYDRRQGPQSELEKLHQAHAELGGKLADLRAALDAARAKVEEAVIARRELVLTFGRNEHERPEPIRKEIAELELHQQTRSLPIDEENALIARLRKRTADLKAAEARGAVVAAHESLRAEADLAITSARAEVERVNEEMRRARKERDAAMAAMRQRLEAAGGLLAELRAKGKTRAELMAEVEQCSRELDEVNRAGRELLARTRARRDEAVRVVRQHALRRKSPDEAIASIAEAHLEELLKGGKVTL